MIAEDKISSLEQRVVALEGELKSLDNAHDLSLEQIRYLQLGRSSDAHLMVFAIMIMAAISVVEAAAILLLWLR